MEDAARKAHVMDFISHLENGFDTIIGENNLGVSGGQAKRIALARVILSNKPILLLDEPTASIDSQIELALLKEIRDFAKDKNVIVVSHREQTIAWAHKKYRIANGECYAF